MRLRCVHLVDNYQNLSEAPGESLMGILTGIFQNHFFLSSFQNIFFHRIFANQPIDVHMGFLPNSMSSGHRLQIVLGIPIALQNTVQKQNKTKTRIKGHTSKIMTVSAVSRLIPSPPARVDSKKAKSGDPGVLKWAIDFLRDSDDTIPSKR